METISQFRDTSSITADERAADRVIDALEEMRATQAESAHPAIAAAIAQLEVLIAAETDATRLFDGILPIIAGLGTALGSSK